MVDSKGKKAYIREKFKEFKETGDLKLREELIEEHLYIAAILAKKFVNRGIDYDDLYQVACLGLINAVDRYDVDKGYEFSSFATPTITGEIKRYFRDKGWTIRVTRRIQELSKKVNNAKVYLAQEMQKVPTIKDIADHLEVSEEDVLEAMEASKVYSPHSLDKEYDRSMEDSEYNLKDVIGYEDYNFDNIELEDFLNKALEEFTDLEKEIIIYRFYYKDTQISIAERLNISQMTVSRIEKKLVKKIKEEYRNYNNI